MRIIPLAVLVACLAWQVAARPQEDAEPRAPSRGLLKRGQLVKGKPTTTTTVAPPEEVEYEEEAEYPEGEGQEASTEAPASSTEGKKLVGNGVRPFRSNTDLLETLKRKRAQAAEAKHHGQNVPAASPQSQEAPADSPVKAYNNINRYRASTVIKEDIKTSTNDNRRTKISEKRQSTTPQYNSKRRITNRKTTADYSDIETTTISKKNKPELKNRKTTEKISGPVLYSRDKKRFNKEKETSEDSPVSPSKPNRNRFSRPSSRAAQEPEPEEQNEPVPAPVRTGRTFRKI